LGLIISAFSLSYAAFILVRTLVQGVDVPGYASLLVSILFLGGVQLIGMGVLGEYVGRMYQEAKHRPIYIVRATYERAQRGEPPSARPAVDSAAATDRSF